MRITSSRAIAAAGLASATLVSGCGVTHTALHHEIDLVGPVSAPVVRGARAQARTLGWPLRVRAATATSAGDRIRAVNATVAATPAAVIVAAGAPEALAAPLQTLRSTGIAVERVPPTGSAAAGAAAVRRAVTASRGPVR